MSDKPLTTEPLIPSYDPFKGVVRGERLGRAPSVEELMAANDLSFDHYEVVSDSIKTNTWPTSMKLAHRDEEGSLEYEEPIQVWNHQLSFKVRALTDEITSTAIKDDLLREIREEVRDIRDPAPEPMTRLNGGTLVVVDLFDPHFQKLAWGPETGENYDLHIAAQRYREAFIELRERVRRTGVPIHRWLFTIGQDLFHTDNDKFTTARGTLQDVDSRTPKAARLIRRLLTDVTLDMLADAPVDIINVPGNHGPDRDWFMGEILDARFESNENVRVDNRPISRKYYRFGNTLIGLTHGDKTKWKDMRDYMTNEAPHDFAETKFREWHVGHFHHERTVDERGVIVRYLPSLAGTDKWHFDKGWAQATKGAKAFVYGKESGLMLTVHHQIPQTEEEASFTAPMLRGDDPLDGS